MSHDVFVSYSSNDKSIAGVACAELEQAGIRCWIAPRDILPSQPWAESIVEAIGGSRMLVVIFSAASNASVQVLRETERGVSKGIPILPFRIEDVAPSGSLEYFLATPHWLDAITPPLERHLQELVATVKLLLASDAANDESTPVVEVAELEILREVAPDQWAAPKSKFGRIVRRMLEDR